MNGSIFSFPLYDAVFLLLFRCCRYFITAVVDFCLQVGAMLCQFRFEQYMQ